MVLHTARHVLYHLNSFFSIFFLFFYQQNVENFPPTKYSCYPHLCFYILICKFWLVYFNPNFSLHISDFFQFSTKFSTLCIVENFVENVKIYIPRAFMMVGHALVKMFHVKHFIFTNYQNRHCSHDEKQVTDLLEKLELIETFSTFST